MANLIDYFSPLQSTIYHIKSIKTSQHSQAPRYTRRLSQAGCRGTHLADALVLLVLFVVAGEQEAAVLARALAAAHVAADHHQVQRVAHTVHVVLLQLRHNPQQRVRMSST